VRVSRVLRPTVTRLDLPVQSVPVRPALLLASSHTLSRMLKRRAASPPPSSSDIPMSSCFPVRNGDHTQKRRRIAAPVLDGPSRGWLDSGGNGQGDKRTLSSEEDEEWPEDLAGERQMDGHLKGVDDEHYRSVNALLRELHEQRRALVSRSCENALTRSPSQDFSSQSCEIVKRYPLPLRSQASTVNDPWKLSGSVDDERYYVMEEDHVKKRYQDTNRCAHLLSEWHPCSVLTLLARTLRDLFLNRRHILDSGQDLQVGGTRSPSAVQSVDPYS
jgi:hypothetical protein